MEQEEEPQEQELEQEQAIETPGGFLPSRAVCIAAGLAISVAVFSVANMVLGMLFMGGLRIDLGFLGWFVGVGLLHGSESARRWAVFFSAAGALLTVALVGISGYRFFAGGDVDSSTDQVPLIFFGLLFLILCLNVFASLRTAVVKEWFAGADASPQREALASKIVWPVAIATLLMALASTATEWSHQRQLDAIYHYDVTIIPHDAQTGEGIRELAWSNRPSESAKFGERRFSGSQLTAIPRGADGGMLIRMYGMADGPITISIGAEGYVAQELTIDDDSPTEIRLPMRRREE